MSIALLDICETLQHIPLAYACIKLTLDQNPSGSSCLFGGLRGVLQFCGKLCGIRRRHLQLHAEVSRRLTQPAQDNLR